MMDSLTRFAMAQREVGLSAGEPPATRGYPPSVFALLPRLLERAGAAARGSITGLYTVLVEGDDLNEPIADAARSILDGHVVLSRQARHRRALPEHRRPRVDLPGRRPPSPPPEQRAAAPPSCASCWPPPRDAKDLIEIGAYVAGHQPARRTPPARITIVAFMYQASDRCWSRARRSE